MRAVGAEWLAVQDGSVLRWPSGRLRVVRHVSRSYNRRAGRWRKVYLYFVIKHCSWTGRGYTLYNVGELVGMGVTVTSAPPVRLGGARHWRMMTDIKKNKGCKPTITCCEVEGMQ